MARGRSRIKGEVSCPERCPAGARGLPGRHLRLPGVAGGLGWRQDCGHRGPRAGAGRVQPGPAEPPGRRAGAAAAQLAGRGARVYHPRPGRERRRDLSRQGSRSRCDAGQAGALCLRLHALVRRRSLAHARGDRGRQEIHRRSATTEPPPLFQQLGIDIDAMRHAAQVTPGARPSIGCGRGAEREAAAGSGRPGQTPHADTRRRVP